MSKQEVIISIKQIDNGWLVTYFDDRKQEKCFLEKSEAFNFVSEELNKSKKEQ